MTSSATVSRADMIQNHVDLGSAREAAQATVDKLIESGVLGDLVVTP